MIIPRSVDGVASSSASILVKPRQAAFVFRFRYDFNPVTDFPVGGNSFGALKTEKFPPTGVIGGEITAVLSIRENILSASSAGEEEILSEVE